MRQVSIASLIVSLCFLSSLGARYTLIPSTFHKLFCHHQPTNWGRNASLCFSLTWRLKGGSIFLHRAHTLSRIFWHRLNTPFITPCSQSQNSYSCARVMQECFVSSPRNRLSNLTENCPINQAECTSFGFILTDFQEKKPVWREMRKTEPFSKSSPIIF